MICMKHFILKLSDINIMNYLYSIGKLRRNIYTRVDIISLLQFQNALARKFLPNQCILLFNLLGNTFFSVKHASAKLKDKSRVNRIFVKTSFTNC